MRACSVRLRPPRRRSVVRPARRVAMLGLLLMALTGSVLFTAEASHVAMNPVFQIKAALIALGRAQRAAGRRGALDAVLADTPAHDAAACPRAALRIALLDDLDLGCGLRTTDRLLREGQREGVRPLASS